MVESPFSAFETAINDNSAIAKLIALLILAGYVFAGGFWNGFYGHILLTTGWDISTNETIMLHVLNTSCGVFGTFPNGYASESLCQEGYSGLQSTIATSNLFSTILPILLLVVAIIVIIYTTTQDSPWLIIGGLVFALLLAFVLNQIGYQKGFELLGGTSNIPSYTTSTSTTSTTTSSTSTSTTSTSTSTSTTTIPPYTACPIEPQVGNYIPLKCYNPVFRAPNYISFNFTLNRNATAIYNINLACSAHIQRPPFSQFYPLQQNGMPNLSQNASGTSILPGQIISVEEWPCAASNSIGTFEGYVWINYTRNSGPIVSLNPWDSYRTFDVYINATLSSSAYNQTKNMS